MKNRCSRAALLAACLACAAFPALRAAPDAPAPGETRAYDRQGVRLLYASDAPGFDPAERDRLVEAFFAAYPRLAAAFNPGAPATVRLSVEARYRGIAATAADTIHLNPDWFRLHPEDVDVITHEAMHVVQQYPPGQPGWLVEGLADYARERYGANNARADWSLPDYRSGQSYTDSYRVTARFLVWLEARVKPGLAAALDRALRAGAYTSETWRQQTGRDVDALWQEYARQPELATGGADAKTGAGSR